MRICSWPTHGTLVGNGQFGEVVEGSAPSLWQLRRQACRALARSAQRGCLFVHRPVSSTSCTGALAAAMRWPPASRVESITVKSGSILCKSGNVGLAYFHTEQMFQMKGYSTFTAVSPVGRSLKQTWQVAAAYCERTTVATALSLKTSCPAWEWSLVSALLPSAGLCQWCKDHELEQTRLKSCHIAPLQSTQRRQKA